MAEDSDKVNAHRSFLKRRETASRTGRSYPITRSEKKINKGDDAEEVGSQRASMNDDAPKLNLRLKRRNR